MRLADTGLRRIANEMRMWDRCNGKSPCLARNRGGGQSVAGTSWSDRPEEGSLNTYRCPRCLCWHVGHTRRAAPVDGRLNLG